MSQKEDKKWYFRNTTLAVAILCVGPLALPLLWANPGFRPKGKIFISIAIIVLSIVLFIGFARSLESAGDYYKMLDDMLKQ
ncbi:MAG: hypothetical protein WC515_04535 [Candidatus Omnitrophota bacterium]